MSSDMRDRPLPEDVSVEGHRARIQAAVEAYIGSLKLYTDEIIKLYAPHVRHWTGDATAIQTSAKTVTVQEDALPQAETPPPMPMGWGRKTWSAGQIVGKRVRFMVDTESKGHWIDDTLS